MPTADCADAVSQFNVEVIADANPQQNKRVDALKMVVKSFHVIIVPSNYYSAR